MSHSLSLHSADYITIDCWWCHKCIMRHNNCDAHTWKAISNLSDIDFIHGHIHSRSYDELIAAGIYPVNYISVHTRIIRPVIRRLNHLSDSPATDPNHLGGLVLLYQFPYICSRCHIYVHYLKSQFCPMINSFDPSDTIWCSKTCSTLV